VARDEPDDQGVPASLVERVGQRLDERIAALAAVSPEPPDPAAARALEPKPDAAPPEASQAAGAWDPTVLECLVDGSVPATFDRLIQGAFTEPLP
jgi:hypothetical protein